VRPELPHAIPVVAQASPAVLLVVLLIPLAALDIGTCSAAESTPQQQVEGRLMCYCGCSDLTVRVCTCGTADGIRQEITERLAGGQTADQVVAAFVAQFGEQIRSAPTTTGFDLVAWITPFALLILAGAALVVVVRRWGAAQTAADRLSSDRPAADDEHPPAAGARRALERVRRELGEDR